MGFLPFGQSLLFHLWLLQARLVCNNPFCSIICFRFISVMREFRKIWGIKCDDCLSRVGCWVLFICNKTMRGSYCRGCRRCRRSQIGANVHLSAIQLDKQMEFMINRLIFDFVTTRTRNPTSRGSLWLQLLWRRPSLMGQICLKWLCQRLMLQELVLRVIFLYIHLHHLLLLLPINCIHFNVTLFCEFVMIWLLSIGLSSTLLSDDPLSRHCYD